MKVGPQAFVRMSYTISPAEPGLDFGPVGPREFPFVFGEGHVPEALEAAIRGLRAGETASARIEAEEAFGPHRPDLVATGPRDFLPWDEPCVPGRIVELPDPEGGRSRYVRVVAVDGDEVTLDFNHPLAGRPVRFDMTILEVRPVEQADWDAILQEEAELEAAARGGHPEGCGCGCHGEGGE
ncbi:peptidylprolyl isomerase [Dissulfurirhabdus thermomarina]|uniref:peptidylprolyl isomerase n=1 Tax=Dissulfurirhabdus thermomarina TaxID=1765737 RepID=A0A6N9TNC1_DISTH|nr:FKBP-type peptidyl-prolyl cis-trans isomerase [Dissulfurirhabdus thermomarina]NDY42639.1 peptidylprolyl isomerase [Dissulfurirhabdus thermomarina]NMX22685.1 peptidylprolyl isomerase [Dissulfurirhabdus thermomarina]